MFVRINPAVDIGKEGIVDINGWEKTSNKWKSKSELELMKINGVLWGK